MLPSGSVWGFYHPSQLPCVVHSVWKETSLGVFFFCRKLGKFVICLLRHPAASMTRKNSCYKNYLPTGRGEREGLGRGSPFQGRSRRRCPCCVALLPPACLHGGGCRFVCFSCAFVCFQGQLERVMWLGKPWWPLSMFPSKLWGVEGCSHCAGNKAEPFTSL